MSGLQARFSNNKQLIPYLVGGWPNPSECASIFEALAESGCSIIEVGIPYSDPLADGPTIQRASEAALADGINTETVLDMIRGLKDRTDASPVLMVYYNLIYRYGLDRFAKAAAQAGVAGAIVPDLTVEESNDWRQAAADSGLDTIFLVAPTSSAKRLSKIVASSTGFVYAVSLTGVTGARTELPDDLKDFISRVKEIAELPVAVGFGVSRPDQAAMISRLADGVIVGSALVDIIEKAGVDAKEKVRQFADSLIAAIRGDQ